MTCEEELIEVIKSGQVSAMSQNWQADGSCDVTVLAKDGSVYKAHIVRLYEPDMQIMTCEVVNVVL